MASVPERLEEALEREAPTWGIRPRSTRVAAVLGHRPRHPVGRPRDRAARAGDRRAARALSRFALRAARDRRRDRDRLHPARAGRRRGRAGGGAVDGPVPAGPRPPRVLPPVAREPRAARRLDGVRVLGDGKGRERGLRRPVRHRRLPRVARGRRGRVHGARAGRADLRGAALAGALRRAGSSPASRSGSRRRCWRTRISERCGRGRAAAGCRSGSRSISSSPCPCRGCRSQPTTRGSGAIHGARSWGRRPATPWATCGSTSSARSSCSRRAPAPTWWGSARRSPPRPAGASCCSPCWSASRIRRWSTCTRPPSPSRTSGRRGRSARSSSASG